MKTFDLHADLACAIAPYHENKESAVLKNHWLDLMHEGEMGWTAAASFFRGVESWKEMMDTVTMVRNDIEESGGFRILSVEDLHEDQNTTAFLMTIEGMCGIHDHVAEKIQWLYDQGSRIGSLEWNDQNDLATGNSGDPGRGLTPLGKEAVKKMNELHFIVDVSHANEHTFWDILDTSELPVIATHSNAKKLCFVERNLTDQQIRALAAKGGLIGMNACRAFVHEDADKQDALHLAEHAAYIADLVGVEHVACGFDYGDYYSDQSEDYDMSGPQKTQNFIAGLRKVGFNEEEIEKIAYKNVFQFLRKYM